MTFAYPIWLALLPLFSEESAPVPAPSVAVTAPTDLFAFDECIDSLDVAIFNSPRRPHTRGAMRILVAGEHAFPAGVQILAQAKKSTDIVALPLTTSGGPPYGLIGVVDRPKLGVWRVGVVANGAVLACQEIEVRSGPSGPGNLEVGVDPHWETRIKWERDTENLYSLWIERLFDAPVTEDLSWNPLALVLKDESRNLLYDHLGLDEDKDGVRADPDCADFPYTMRAYFAWKMGLPMAMRQCRRGNADRAPTCGDNLVTNELVTEETNRVAAFKAFLRKLEGTVHSSSLRGAPGDEGSDLYPVRLDRRGLRPGTIYADPYGHTMMILRWYPQTADAAGLLMAVDAQPDGTVGRRVFWKGAFLFPKDDDVAGAGWKRFRPVRRGGSDGYVELSNAAIAESIDYGDYSTEQWTKGQDGFYEAMDALISPRPMPPEAALVATLEALYQQALRRVESIEAVRPYFDKGGKVITMPKGSEIFLTAGPWEDFSTPSRDMRMLIAIDTVLDFPARVVRRPERFVLANEAPEARAARLTALTEAEAKKRPLSYQRSDGSTQTITLWDLMQRKLGIELAWNPNDCPEVRWGAPEGSAELAPCKRRAPDEQYQRMLAVRSWFEKRARPLQH